MRFKEWLKQEAELPYNPKIKLKDANWQGAVGTPGKVIQGEPVKQNAKRTS